MQNVNTRAAARAAVLSLLAAVGHAAAADAARADTEPRAIAVPIAGRLEVFEIANPGATVSAAERLDARSSQIAGGRVALAGGARPAAIGTGWSLSDRVLVRAPDAGIVDLALSEPGVRIAPVEGVPGWFVVEAGRIDRAVEYAARLGGARGISTVELDATMPTTQRGLPNDTFFSFQWHLHNASNPGVDIGVTDVWDMGYTGAGVNICIVESFGFQVDHPDLTPNVDLGITQPGVFNSSHMTAVAGLAAAKGNNGIGVTGVAYDATLSQALIGSNEQVAAALLLLNDVNDVKNNSWGPTDNGLIDPMPAIVNDALIESVTTGRGGLGEVIVWAGGNGASSNDRVDYDPFASSRYTIAVGAVGDDDVVSNYSEPGSSLLVSAYSDGGALDITSTTTNSSYTFIFGGTSAASPIAAGVVALMLQANPDLTWRDVQHLLVETARPVTLGDETWGPNGSGRLFSENYGYGLVHAPDAVAAALTWTGVDPEVSTTTGVLAVDAPIPDADVNGVERVAVINESIRVESVELVMNVQTPYIGDLEISLTSPDGTVSVLTDDRFDHQDDLVNTVFTSMKHWGERSEGTWTVKVADRRAGNNAVWQDFELRVHGIDLGAPPCSPVDYAEPFGVLDLDDIVGFLTAYAVNDPDADLAEPFGVWDLADITRFVVLFTSGCP